MDAAFNGQLKIWQPVSGYRYTLDPVILAAELAPPPGSRILDIGCGCGIMPLIICFRHPDVTAVGVEIQEELAAPARHNITENRMADRISLLCKDIMDTSLEDIGGAADLIIANPPYKKSGAGRINPHGGKAIARHEQTLDIRRLFSVSARLLTPEGRITLIFPSERTSELYAAADQAGFGLEWIRRVHQREETPPFRILASAARNPKASCRVRPPLYLYTQDRTPTKAYQALFNP